MIRWYSQEPAMFKRKKQIDKFKLQFVQASKDKAYSEEVAGLVYDEIKSLGWPIKAKSIRLTSRLKEDIGLDKLFAVRLCEIVEDLENSLSIKPIQTGEPILMNTIEDVVRYLCDRLALDQEKLGVDTEIILNNEDLDGFREK